MAKSSGIRSSKSTGNDIGSPTVQGTLNMIKLHADSAGRAVIAELRDSLPGTREQQDDMLKQMQIDGKIVLMKDDAPSRSNKRWQDGGVAMPGVAPRVFAYLVR